MKTRCIGLLFLGVLVSAAGCRDERRHKASEEVAFGEVPPPVPREAPPEEVVKAFVGALTELQHVRASGLGSAEGRERYDRAVATIRSLSARAMIHDRVRKYRSQLVPRDVSENAALRIVIDSWVSMAAHYVDGWLLDTLTPSGPGAADRVIVRLQAENPRDRRLLSEIEALPEVAAAKAKRDQAGSDGEYLALARAKALKRGFNVPIRAVFTFQLRKVDGAWRVSWMGIGSPESPPSSVASAPHPTLR